MTKPQTSDPRTRFPECAAYADQLRAVFGTAKTHYARENGEIGKRMDLSKSITLAERKR